MTRTVTALVLLASAAQGAELLVAAASDLAPLAPKLEQAFRQASGHTARFTLGSSGSLARQIENGAPFDVFLSASASYVTDLAKAGHVDAATIVNYAQGRIALWSASGQVKSLGDLKNTALLHIAIPNPQHAPYGVAAKQALERQGLWTSVQPRIVYAENVRQALQFAETRNADAVITSWTLLMGRGILLPAEMHDPIQQAAGLITRTSQPEAARAFLKFLATPAARTVLAAGGLFLPPSAEPRSAPRPAARRSSAPPVPQRGATRRSAHP